jgi:vacuolar protein sorting-associated protein 13A/C
VTYLS